MGEPKYFATNNHIAALREPTYHEVLRGISEILLKDIKGDITRRGDVRDDIAYTMTEMPKLLIEKLKHPPYSLLAEADQVVTALQGTLEYLEKEKTLRSIKWGRNTHGKRVAIEYRPSAVGKLASYVSHLRKPFKDVPKSSSSVIPNTVRTLRAAGTT